jgi:hypothetical protein
MVSARRIVAFNFCMYSPNLPFFLVYLTGLVGHNINYEKNFYAHKMSASISRARRGAVGCGTALQAEGHAFDSRWSHWDFSLT